MNRYVIQLDKENFCIGRGILQEVPKDHIEVPYALYPETRGQKFDSVNMQWVNEYADWYKTPPKAELSESEQRELDRDELLLDNVINAQQIILLLETGGDKA